MPRIEDHQDGTKTFSINSGELGALSSLAQLVPDLDRVLDFLDAPELRTALSFVRTLADSAPAEASADAASDAPSSAPSNTHSEGTSPR